MKKYLFLQTKRQLRFFPAILAVTLVMIVGIAMILSTMLSMNDAEEAAKFKVAITGDTESDYIKLGLTALETLDDTRFTIEFLTLTEDEAHEMLSRGEISAYAVLPEYFIENALAGYIDPIKYVTSAGSGGLTTLFKNEITKLVTDMVIYSEKGSYGIADAIDDNDIGVSSNKHLNKLSIKYVDLILHRSDVIETKELGISLGLSTAQYYACSILILIVILIGLPFGSVCIKKENSLDRLLVSRGFSSVKQMLSEFTAHLISLSLIIGSIILTAYIALPFLGDKVDSIVGPDISDAFPQLLLRMIPVLIMVCAFDILMYELSDNFVSGILIHFFTTISLAYVSGCFYPIYSFPTVIQRLSAVLPTGVAFSFLSGTFTYTTSVLTVVGVLGYTVVFFLLATLMRIRRLNREGVSKA